MEFGTLVHRERAKQYPTAKEFYVKNSISCTYAYYSRIEKGILPEIEVALEILSKLKVHLRTGLTAWVRDQMPNSATKALFTDPSDEVAYTGKTPTVNRALLINRMQAKLLKENPVFWEILLYVVAYFGRKDITVADIAKTFDMKVLDAKRLVDELFEYGLLDSGDNKVFRTKEWLVIPYEEEFQALRDVNFKRAFEKFVQSSTKIKFRTTITKLMNPSDLEIIEAKVVALTNSLIALPEPGDLKEAVPYTVGVFASPRTFGHDD